MAYVPTPDKAEKHPHTVEKRRIFLAFGFHAHKNEEIIWNGNELFVLNFEALPHIGEIDFILLQSGFFNSQDKENDAIKTEKRLMNLLERGKTICFLLSDSNDILTRHILLYNKIACSSVGKVKFLTDILAKNPSLKSS